MAETRLRLRWRASRRAETGMELSVAQMSARPAGGGVGWASESPWEVARRMCSRCAALSTVAVEPFGGIRRSDKELGRKGRDSVSEAESAEESSAAVDAPESTLRAAQLLSERRFPR